MTENERFTLTFDDKIIDNLTGTIHDVHSGYDVAMNLSRLLNDLNEENNKLKQDLDKKNKEIEQLKEELKKYTDAFDCSQCRFQNYDWFDDGDEFEVCEKGNNEAQMENHSCSEWEEL